jgi:folate-binding protein YgfZ
MVAVLGPQAADLLQRALGAPAAQMEPYGSLTVPVGGHDVTLLRSDPLRAPGFDLVVAAEHAPELWETLVAEGAMPIGEQTFDLLRIQEGVPRYDAEMSEELNPWEANLQEYINFEKGCYIGQEVILRLNTYKKVQRRLMALAFSDGAAVVAGDRLYNGEQEAGEVTSVARRPTSGDLIGLGLVKRAFAIAETVLRAGDATATVSELPERVPVAG